MKNIEKFERLSDNSNNGITVADSNLLKIIQEAQQAQNRPGEPKITQDDFALAKVQDLEPEERLLWLRLREKKDCSNNPVGDGNPTNIVDTNTKRTLEEYIVTIPEPVEGEERSVGILRTVGKILQQTKPLVEEDTVLGRYLQEDIKNILQNLGSFNPNRLLHFVGVLQNPSLNEGDIMVGGSEKVTFLNGLAYRLFGLFSIFSSGTIGYLILNLTGPDSSINVLSLLKTIFGTFRCLLLSGIPIKMLLFSERSYFVMALKQALETIQLWIPLVNPNLCSNKFPVLYRRVSYLYRSSRVIIGLGFVSYWALNRLLETLPKPPIDYPPIPNDGSEAIPITFRPVGELLREVIQTVTSSLYRNLDLSRIDWETVKETLFTIGGF